MPKTRTNITPSVTYMTPVQVERNFQGYRLADKIPHLFL